MSIRVHRADLLCYMLSCGSDRIDRGPMDYSSDFPKEHGFENLYPRFSINCRCRSTVPKRPVPFLNLIFLGVNRSFVNRYFAKPRRHDFHKHSCYTISSHLWGITGHLYLICCLEVFSKESPTEQSGSGWLTSKQWESLPGPHRYSADRIISMLWALEWPDQVLSRHRLLLRGLERRKLGL